jgi:hypothetical protein
VASQRKSEGDKARRPSAAPSKVVAEWNRPKPRGRVVDRLLVQLVPELDPNSDRSSDAGPDAPEG